MNDLIALTEEELAEQYRIAVVNRNGELAKRVVKELGRRKVKSFNGEPIEQIFARNPIFEEHYLMGKILNK